MLHLDGPSCQRGNNDDDDDDKKSASRNQTTREREREETRGAEPRKRPVSVLLIEEAEIRKAKKGVSTGRNGEEGRKEIGRLGVGTRLGKRSEMR
jgi:hypothetical protein